MKTIELTVTFTGRVDDNFATILETAWAKSEAMVEIPITKVFLSAPSDKTSLQGFDFCQPNKLTIRPTQ